MAETFTVCWAGEHNGAGQSREQSSESAALALAFAKIRGGDDAVSIRRPDGSEIRHAALLVMMAAD
jgi:hypothetical protein